MFSLAPGSAVGLPIDVVADFVGGLEESALVLDDPRARPGLTPDPQDDYLVALTRAANANFLVSGDQHLTGLVAPVPPVLTPRQFRDLLFGATT
jgi:predicted nucleic acid-binding protein